MLRLMKAPPAWQRHDRTPDCSSIPSPPPRPRRRLRSALSLASSPTPPSPRSFADLSFRLLPKPGASMVLVPSKVQDDEKPTDWSLYEYAWCGPRWWMAFEFADIMKDYPKMPVKNVHIGILLEEGQGTKLGNAMSINLYSLIVKADFKGQEVTKRTMLVMGRDVDELEATAERINKFRSILTLPKNLIWNRKLQ